jgi:hypothetical protein
MRFHIHSFDLFKGRVCIYLRRTERSVTQKRLNRSYICSVIQHRLHQYF